MYKFDASDAVNKCTDWIRAFFEENGAGCNAVIGISGGKDSAVAATICARALGKERVIGVLLPNGEQSDIDAARLLCTTLGIRNFKINIKEAVDGLYNAFDGCFDISAQTRFNLPARVRMTTLYAVSQSNNGRVCNTCNYSEDWVGYSTRWGDSVGDFSPLSCFTVGEVKAMGTVLGLPASLVEKPPTDGLCGKTDEDNLGFSYAVLDAYIREGVLPEKSVKEKIDRMHSANLFKLQMMPSFNYIP